MNIQKMLNTENQFPNITSPQIIEVETESNPSKKRKLESGASFFIHNSNMLSDYELNTGQIISPKRSELSINEGIGQSGAQVPSMEEISQMLDQLPQDVVEIGEPNRGPIQTGNSNIHHAKSIKFRINTAQNIEKIYNSEALKAKIEGYNEYPTILDMFRSKKKIFMNTIGEDIPKEIMESVYHVKFLNIETTIKTLINTLNMMNLAEMKPISISQCALLTSIFQNLYVHLNKECKEITQSAQYFHSLENIYRKTIKNKVGEISINYINNKKMKTK